VECTEIGLPEVLVLTFFAHVVLYLHFDGDLPS
jgi:hypothetical protein